jgi:type I restriction enzyme S subunit
MTSELLPSGWRPARYGEAMVEADERAGEHVDLPVLSVTKTRGPMLASERFGKALHSRDLSRYRVARRNVIVADPMLLWDGSIGIQRVADAGLVSPDYRVYEPSDQAEPAFLAYVVRSPTMLPHYQGGARGTNVRRNRIARSDFLAIPLALPPLSEQRKIAAILSSVDAAIESTQAVIDQLEVVKKAMMAELLTRGLPGRHTRFKQTEIGEVPEHWEITTVGDLATFTGGNGFRPPDWSTAGLPIIRIQNLNGSTDFNYYRPKPDPSWLVEPGELLFAWAGSRGASFGPCVWPGPRGLLNQHIHRIEPKLHVRKSFMYFVLRLLTEAVEKKAHGFKDTLLHLRKGELTGWKVALPPLSDQDEIVGVLASIDLRLESEQAWLTALRTTKTPLMSVLLTGEVRVTPDNEGA